MAAVSHVLSSSEAAVCFGQDISCSGLEFPRAVRCVVLTPCVVASRSVPFNFALALSLARSRPRSAQAGRKD
eukprot:170698-Rhodomonas_salina.1